MECQRRIEDGVELQRSHRRINPFIYIPPLLGNGNDLGEGAQNLRRLLIQFGPNLSFMKQEFAAEYLGQLSIFFVWSDQVFKKSPDGWEKLPVRFHASYSGFELPINGVVE